MKMFYSSTIDNVSIEIIDYKTVFQLSVCFVEVKYTLLINIHQFHSVVYDPYEKKQ